MPLDDRCINIQAFKWKNFACTRFKKALTGCFYLTKVDDSSQLQFSNNTLHFHDVHVHVHCTCTSTSITNWNVLISTWQLLANIKTDGIEHMNVVPLIIHVLLALYITTLCTINITNIKNTFGINPKYLFWCTRQ